VVTTAGVVVVEPDNELFEPIDELLLEELEEELDLLESKPEEELDLLESELEEELDLPESEPEEELDLLESEPEAVTLAAMTITPSKAVIRDWEERMVFMDTIDFLVGESRDDRDFAVSRRRRDEEDRDGRK
jgi:hypothetical protein